MCNALSERPVRGTTACVCLRNETQKTLGINTLEGFSKYHNFNFEEYGIRLWRAHNVGEGKLISYRDFIVNRQGPRGLVVDVPIIPVKDSRLHSTSTSYDCSCLFSCSEPGCQMVLRKLSDLESHLDAGEHRQLQQGCDSYTLYDKIRRDWAEKFFTVDKDVKTCSQLIAPCNSDHLALHKLRSEAVWFSVEVKQYQTAKFDLGESTDNKEDPGKVAADMRMAKNPDGSRMFKRKDWLRKSQVQSFFSRLANTRRRKGN